MAACDVGRMNLFICSVLWDLDMHQEAATITYEDNDGCAEIGSAQKPTSQTRHIDIKYIASCEWIANATLSILNAFTWLSRPLTT